ncbi:MAG: SCP2 sterol-binding domain-containing protein [Xanthobacter sp.]
MSDQPTFDALAEELSNKVRGLGNLGITMKFVFDGEGNVFIDARQDEPTLTRDVEGEADFTILAPMNVWLDLRSKKLAPHVAAMTRKIRFEGDRLRGLTLAPKIMTVL